MKYLAILFFAVVFGSCTKKDNPTPQPEIKADIPKVDTITFTKPAGDSLNYQVSQNDTLTIFLSPQLPIYLGSKVIITALLNKRQTIRITSNEWDFLSTSYRDIYETASVNSNYIITISASSLSSNPTTYTASVIFKNSGN